jgi:hypothetical protein
MRDGGVSFAARRGRFDGKRPVSSMLQKYNPQNFIQVFVFLTSQKVNLYVQLSHETKTKKICTFVTMVC